MNTLIAETILADRQDGDDIGWVRLLIFVILAILFGLGRLLKSKAGVSKEDHEYASAPGRRRPTGTAQRTDRRPVGEPRRPVPVAPAKVVGPRPARPGRQLRRPQPSARKAVVARQERLAPGALGGPVEPSASVQTELSSLPDLDKLEEEITAEPGAEMERITRAARAGELQAGDILERLIGFEGPEDLQKAILHYEILGKPLGLREPSEQLR